MVPLFFGGEQVDAPVVDIIYNYKMGWLAILIIAEKIRVYGREVHGWEASLYGS